MIELTTPVGRVLINENKITAINEEADSSQINCRVWLGETLGEHSGFNILETYDEVATILLELTAK